MTSLLPPFLKAEYIWATGSEIQGFANPTVAALTPNVASWHEADVQRLPGSGLLTGALPTFGPECRLIAAFQTWRRGVSKDRLWPEQPVEKGAIDRISRHDET
jgi:hypothetical protein